MCHFGQFCILYSVFHGVNWIKRHLEAYTSPIYTWGRTLEPLILLLMSGWCWLKIPECSRLGNCNCVASFLQSAVEAEWEPMMRTLRVTEIELCENNVWDVTLTILETDREDDTVLITHHCHRARQFCTQKTSSSLAHIPSQGIEGEFKLRNIKFYIQNTWILWVQTNFAIAIIIAMAIAISILQFMLFEFICKKQRQVRNLLELCSFLFWRFEI